MATPTILYACRTRDHDLCADYGCGCDCHAAERTALPEITGEFRDDAVAVYDEAFARAERHDDGIDALIDFVWAAACAAMSGGDVSAPAVDPHGFTAHGHACCDKAGVSLRPAMTARCGGPALCGFCKQAAADIHATRADE